MGAVSKTRLYDSLLTTTLDKIRDQLADTISDGTKLLYFYKKAGNWKGVKSGGARYVAPTMYALTPADSFGPYGLLNVDPVDGLTNSGWEWRQTAAPITISGMEEFQNRDADGTRIFDLLKTRTRQALLGLEDFWNKAMLQGQGMIDGTSIETARVSPLNSSSFIDPLPLIVKFDPTSSTVIGDINQATNPWWQNQFIDSSASSFAGFLKELRDLYSRCSQGTGGPPDFFITDRETYLLYETALAAAHRNPDYQKADIPFDALAHYGKPVVWDENIADAKSGTTTRTKGTWYDLNSKFMGVAYDVEKNFAPGPFVRPENQDARTAQVMWRGTHWTNNRRKLGVLGDVDLTIAS